VNAVSFELNTPQPDGFFDHVEIDPSGLVRIIGWLRGPVSGRPKVALDGTKLSLLQHYRLARPDVENAAQDIAVRQPGVVFEYLVDGSMIGRKFQTLSVELPSGSRHEFPGEFTFLSPHYRDLFATDRVLHRDRIYGSGPSNPTVHPEILALAKILPGPVLDFGCGSGALVAELKSSGIEARGLELDTDEIRRSIKPEVKSAITLYNGTLPLDWPSRAFASVFCSEVLEHIPDPLSAVKEISRLASEQAIFTVPDISAIPVGFRHSLVPWHLLEGTHVNFFNQTSLHALLKPFFTKLEFGRIGAFSINDSRVFTSLVAFCQK
jgi:SAM-dependent methyltransferase